MASITGCCPVCIEPFNAEEHRPHCIPCGHLFCLPCLTRLPACPVCRTPFHPADIRWLFPTYERPHDNASSTTDCPTVLDWLHESRNDLERRLIALAREEPEDAHAVGKLHAEIKTWLAAYHAAQLPQSPETHALSLAAASLDIAARRTAAIAELRSQLTELRRTLRRTTRAHHAAALQIQERDIEIRALRELNGLYRAATGMKAEGALRPLRGVPAYSNLHGAAHNSNFKPSRKPKHGDRTPAHPTTLALEEFTLPRSASKYMSKQKYAGKVETEAEVKTTRRSKPLEPVRDHSTREGGGVERERERDRTHGRDRDTVHKSVTWFRTSLRRASVTGGSH